jgi:dipeptidase
MHWKYHVAVICAVSALVVIAPGFAGEYRSGTHPRNKCSTIIVGKKLAADGSVILAHNEDLGNYSAHHYVFVPHAKHAAGEVAPTLYNANVPQVPETFAYTGTRIFDIRYYPGDVTSGINEYQVAVVNNASYRRDTPDHIPKDGRIIWTEFTKFALERAKTAEEAVQVIGALASKYKLGVDSGTMFGITDPKDAWWVEVTLDGQWAAQRVRDNEA